MPDFPFDSQEACFMMQRIIRCISFYFLSMGNLGLP